MTGVLGPDGRSVRSARNLNDKDQILRKLWNIWRSRSYRWQSSHPWERWSEKEIGQWVLNKRTWDYYNNQSDRLNDTDGVAGQFKSRFGKLVEDSLMEFEEAVGRDMRSAGRKDQSLLVEYEMIKSQIRTTGIWDRHRIREYKQKCGIVLPQI